MLHRAIHGLRSASIAKPGESPALPFAGRNVVLTGASSGIGRAIASQLAVGGAQLHTAGRTHDTSLTPDFFAADLDNGDELEQWICHLMNTVPRIDLLIHSAGAFSTGPVAQTSMADFNRILNLNFRVPFRLTQAVLPLLRAAGGQIVFINSSVATRRGHAAYAASKQALRAFADVLRDEVNEEGIRVLSIYPGRTATPMQMNIHIAECKPWKPERLLQPEDIACTVLHSLLLPRTAEITDIHIRPLQKT